MCLTLARVRRVSEGIRGALPFLFPTLGENYGHVIFEALAAGCPVIVSDQTPWQDLEKREVGWVIPLADQQRYCQVIEQILSEPLVVRQQRALRCIHYAQEVAQDPAVLEANLALFPPTD